MDRREVIAKCMEMGVPIFQGRIDKTLFLASLKQGQTQASAGPRRNRTRVAPPLDVRTAAAGGCTTQASREAGRIQSRRSRGNGS
jgi:hypothetical protein